MTTIVAEIGNTHDGSLGNAHAFIDAVAEAGADAVKFQCHIAEAESTLTEQFPARFQFHPQDSTRKGYWKRMEFTISQWFELSKHAHENELEFIVSAFSVEAVRRITHLVDRWKIPSGETNNTELLRACRAAGKGVIVSTGMSTMAEVDGALLDLGDFKREDVTVLQCTTEYPTLWDCVGLNIFHQFNRNICFLGGLSDHSGTIWPSIAAAVHGASMVEVHVCWDRRQFGADTQSSLTIDEFEGLCYGVRYVERMLASPVDKDKMAASLTDAQVYRKGKRR